MNKPCGDKYLRAYGRGGKGQVQMARRVLQMDGHCFGPGVPCIHASRLFDLCCSRLLQLSYI